MSATSEQIYSFVSRQRILYRLRTWCRWLHQNSVVSPSQWQTFCCCKFFVIKVIMQANRQTMSIWLVPVQTMPNDHFWRKKYSPFQCMSIFLPEKIAFLLTNFVPSVCLLSVRQYKSWVWMSCSSDTWTWIYGACHQILVLDVTVEEKGWWWCHHCQKKLSPVFYVLIG